MGEHTRLNVDQVIAMAQVKATQALAYAVLAVERAMSE